MSDIYSDQHEEAETASEVDVCRHRVDSGGLRDLRAHHHRPHAGPDADPRWHWRIRLGGGLKMVPRFGEFCSYCCLPLLPQLACSIHSFTLFRDLRFDFAAHSHTVAIYNETFVK